MQSRTELIIIALSHSIWASAGVDFSWSWWLVSCVLEFRKAMTRRSNHSGCCSYHCFEIAVMKCSATSRGAVRSVESAMKRTWECLEEFQASFHRRDASKSDDLPLKQTPNAPRSRTRREFYYHTNKICLQRKTWNWNEIELNQSQWTKIRFQCHRRKIVDFWDFLVWLSIPRLSTWCRIIEIDSIVHKK